MAGPWLKVVDSGFTMFHSDENNGLDMVKIGWLMVRTGLSMGASSW